MTGTASTRRELVGVARPGPRTRSLSVRVCCFPVRPPASAAAWAPSILEHLHRHGERGAKPPRQSEDLQHDGVGGSQGSAAGQYNVGRITADRGGVEAAHIEGGAARRFTWWR
jgi:hypothetical protein